MSGAAEEEAVVAAGIAAYVGEKGVNSAEEAGAAPVSKVNAGVANAGEQEQGVDAAGQQGDDDGRADGGEGGEGDHGDDEDEDDDDFGDFNAFEEAPAVEAPTECEDEAATTGNFVKVADPNCRNRASSTDFCADIINVRCAPFAGLRMHGSGLPTGIPTTGSMRFNKISTAVTVMMTCYCRWETFN